MPGQLLLEGLELKAGRGRLGRLDRPLAGATRLGLDGRAVGGGRPLRGGRARRGWALGHRTFGSRAGGFAHPLEQGDLEQQSCVGAFAQLGLHLHQALPEGEQLAAPGGPGDLLQARGGRLAQALSLPVADREHSRLPNRREEPAHQLADVPAGVVEGLQPAQHAGGVVRDGGGQDLDQRLRIGQSQQLAGPLHGQLADPLADQLVEQGDAVAHAALAQPRDQGQ